jgi:hypothetical protein
MKLAAKSLLFLIALTATTSAFAQTIPHFDHIVVIFQENRTPDNLFGSLPTTSIGGCGTEVPFEPGVDLQNGGPNKVNNDTITCLNPEPLGPTCIDPDHSHYGFTKTLDLVGGVPKMDGACVNYQGCQPNGLQCPPYTYVQLSDVRPYFDIAKDYGFANYMFQTNEGPSFPAHQFIFSGTSGPTEKPLGYYDWFDAENMGETAAAGCIAPVGQTSLEINPSGTESLGYTPPGFNQGYPCYDHPTLIDILPPKVNWKYYSNSQGSIWSAPTAIKHICGGIGQGSCPNFAPGHKYATNMVFESHNNLVPIFNDINTCNLAALSWVIPDARWSDHPGNNINNGAGPNYVANIVNAIGWSTCTDPDNGLTYWHNTAILITWDDWGGWYDHVPPFMLGGEGNGWGASYTYGFRVPLLVVSPYTKAGYVSGAISGPPSYPPPLQFTHDFGSILAFVEYNFLGASGIGSINSQDKYPFADSFAPDWNHPQGNVPLQDFFLFPYRDFTAIPIDPPYNTPTYFTNYQGDPLGPEGPDD